MFVSKCPFKLGDKVKFVPSERTKGWHQHSFERLGLKPGQVGQIEEIRENTYIYIDKEKKGGFPWTDFRKVDE